MDAKLTTPILLALAGCQSAPVALDPVTYVCPPTPLELECPDPPDGHPLFLEDLLSMYHRARTAALLCGGAVDAWEEAWSRCARESK